MHLLIKIILLFFVNFSIMTSDLDLGIIEEPVIPLPPKLPEGKKFTLIFPYLGPVDLFPFVENNVLGLKSPFPSSSKVVGPLTIQSGDLRMIGDRISYHAQGTFYGAKTDISAEFSQNDKTYTFTLDFKEKPKIKFLEQELTLESGQIIFDKAKSDQIRIVANTKGTSIKLGEVQFEPSAVKISVFGANSTLSLLGVVNVLGVPMQSELQVKSVGGKQILVAVARAPEGFKLADKFAALKAVGDITLNNLHIIISNAEFDEILKKNGVESKITYRPGINFYADTTLSGPLEQVAELTNSKNTTLTISGSLSTNPSLRAFLPNGLPFRISNLEVGNFILEMELTPPKLFLTTVAKAILEGDQALNFATTVNFSPISAGFSGTLIAQDGVWQNPFGVKGVSVGNMALKFEIPLPTPTIPKEIGIAGSICLTGQMKKNSTNCRDSKGADAQSCGKTVEIQINNKEISEDTSLCGGGIGACMAVKLPDLLSGELDRFFLSDMVKYAAQLMKIKVDVEKLVPVYGVECVKIYVAPKDTQIGEIQFKRGFNLTGKLRVLNAEAFLMSQISDSGIKAHGYTSQINIPSSGKLLRISGTGGREKPELKVEFGIVGAKVNFLFYIDGEINLASMFKHTTSVNISPEEIRFLFESVFGNSTLKTKDGKPLLLAKVEGKSAQSGNDFALDISFMNYLQTYLKEQANAGFESVKNDVNKAFVTAQDEIKKVDNVAKNFQAQIVESQKKVEEAKKSLNEIDKAIADAQSSLKTAKDKVLWFDKQIKELDENSKEDDIKRLFYYSALKSAQAALDAAEFVATNTLKASREVAERSLNLANSFLGSVSKVSVETLKLSAQAASNIVKEIGSVAHETLSTGQSIINSTVGIIDLYEISYKGQLSQLIEGVLGNVKVKGKAIYDFSINVTLDTKDILKSLTNIAKSILEQFTSTIFNMDQNLKPGIEAANNFEKINKEVDLVNAEKVKAEREAKELQKKMQEMDKQIQAVVAKNKETLAKFTSELDSEKLKKIINDPATPRDIYQIAQKALIEKRKVK